MRDPLNMQMEEKKRSNKERQIDVSIEKISTRKVEPDLADQLERRVKVSIIQSDNEKQNEVEMPKLMQARVSSQLVKKTVEELPMSKIIDESESKGKRNTEAKKIGEITKQKSLNVLIKEEVQLKDDLTNENVLEERKQGIETKKEEQIQAVELSKAPEVVNSADADLAKEFLEVLLNPLTPESTKREMIME